MLTLLLLLLQDDAARDAAKKTITAKDLARHLQKLCTEMEGRKSAQAGEKKVAQYVAAAFKEWGLKPAGEKESYLQEFPVSARGTEGTGYNVFGLVEGEIKDEIIAVGAHMDAVGGVGADDNGSGTVAVLELAEALGGMKQKPKRSILFCTWGSEELWMVGSYHWAKNPTVPLDKVKVYLNLDMVGRNDGAEKYVWIAGAESGDPSLKPAIEKHVKGAGIKVYAEDPMISPPGDIMPFYENGKPFLYFYTYSYGKVHPDYHKKSDLPEKIHFASEEKIARLALDILIEIANLESMPKKVDGYKFPHPLYGKPKK